MYATPDSVMIITHIAQIIGKYIDQVDELGDIGAVNMDNISKIISKTRNLTEHNVRLLYNITNTSLTIYDSTSASNFTDYTLLAEFRHKISRQRHTTPWRCSTPTSSV
jgi:hypothetical protein